MRFCLREYIMLQWNIPRFMLFFSSRFSTTRNDLNGKRRYIWNKSPQRNCRICSRYFLNRFITLVTFHTTVTKCVWKTNTKQRTFFLAWIPSVKKTTSTASIQPQNLRVVYFDWHKETKSVFWVFEHSILFCQHLHTLDYFCFMICLNVV